MGWGVWVQRVIACGGRAWSWVSREGRVPEGVGLEGILAADMLKGKWNRMLRHVGTAGEGRRTWVRRFGLLEIEVQNVVYKFVER